VPIVRRKYHTYATPGISHSETSEKSNKHIMKNVHQVGSIIRPQYHFGKVKMYSAPLYRHFGSVQAVRSIGGVEV